MKKVTSTLTLALLCLYANAQVGALDPAFNSTATPGYSINTLIALDDDYGQAIATHSDGRIVVAAYNTNKWFTLFRYLTDGTLDPAFGTGGKVMLRAGTNQDAIAYAVTVLSDNKILVAGSSFGSKKDFALLKLKENGTADSSFGTAGWAVTSIGSFHDEARGMAVQNDGKIVLVGVTETGSLNSEIYDFAVARFNSDGSIDGGFAGGKVITPINGNDIAESVAVQPLDGKIVVGGTSDVDGDANYTVVRYNANGTPDGGFASSSVASIDLATGGFAGSTDLGHALVLQTDGKILMTGQSAPGTGGNNNVVTVRLTTDGTLDDSFNGSGIANFNYGTVNTDEGARTIALQSDGKIIVGGDTDGAGPTFAFLLVRYNTNGKPDSTFSSDGVATVDIVPTEDEYGYAIKLFNNRIYFAGATVEPGETSKDFVLAAIQNDGTPLPLVLSSFYAQKQTSKVVLQWQTSSEEGVKQFVIERSNDGKTYKSIGQVAAAGNSTFTKNYSFADQSPFMSANNYYRLLMQDVDGNYKYSKILIIKFDGQLSANMQVFPSPVKDILQVQLPDGMKGTVGLQIIDMNGRVVRRNNLASDGNALNTTLDVSTLIKGVYILKAQAGNTTVISRFTKQ